MHSRGGVSLGGGVMGIVLQLLHAFPGRATGPAAGSATGLAAMSASPVLWIAARSCWLSTPRSARAWRRASGSRSIWRPSRRWCWSMLVLLALVLRHHDLRQPRRWASLTPGRDRHRVLRLQEEPRQRRADGNVLFSGQAVGLIVLPLMLFHQIQLMVCAMLARRYLAQHDVTGDVPECSRPLRCQTGRTSAA